MEPIYIPGRRRTGSRPSNTVISSTPYDFCDVVEVAVAHHGMRRPCREIEGCRRNGDDLISGKERNGDDDDDAPLEKVRHAV